MFKAPIPEIHLWEVHVDLGHLNKVSKQHALIVYYFEEECFDLICLSDDYSVKVTQYAKQQTRELTAVDGPLSLESKDKIQISSEEFLFYLPSKKKGEPKKREETKQLEAMEIS